MPLHHPPGHAQVDFGEATVEVGGQIIQHRTDLTRTARTVTELWDAIAQVTDIFTPSGCEN